MLVELLGIMIRNSIKTISSFTHKILPYLAVLSSGALMVVLY